MICARVVYGNAVYIGLSSTEASKLQSVLNAAASLIGASQSSPISLLLSETHFTGFLFVSAIQDLLCHERLTGSAPQYLKVYCIPVSSIPNNCPSPSFDHRVGATWWFPGHETSMSLEVLLLWAHRTGTSYLRPIETFCQHHLISSASI